MRQISHHGVWHLPNRPSLGQVLRAWAQVSSSCLRLHQEARIGETRVVGYFPQLLLSQGHKLLSCFLDWGCLILAASVFTPSSNISNTHYVRDWSFALEMFWWTGQIRVPVLLELIESRTKEGKQGARTYCILFNSEMMSAGKEEDFLGFKAIFPALPLVALSPALCFGPLLSGEWLRVGLHLNGICSPNCSTQQPTAAGSQGWRLRLGWNKAESRHLAWKPSWPWPSIVPPSSPFILSPPDLGNASFAI